MRVLVVEDNLDLCDILREVLLHLGHQPRMLISAEAALIALRTERPDVILLDIYLPGMSGLEFLQHPVVRESRIPVVAVSGLTTEDEARQCLELGAADFLAKPVPLERLAEVLACLEPEALTHARESTAPGAERRRAPRVRVALPVRVREDSGLEWEGISVDLSVSGTKLRSDHPIRPGPVAQLFLTPPGGEAPLTLHSRLVRIDLDGYAFYFMNLTPEQLGRLGRLVERAGAFP